MTNRQLTYAYLETTNYCNLDCSYCNRKEVIGNLKHMSVTDFKKVLDSIKHHPIKEAKLMGMGEPFMHPQFDIICKLFKETFPNAFLIVATNCQFKIKKTFIESLKYIDLLYFSIDGYKENYERDRSPAKWSKLINFLTEFKKLNRYECKVACNYVVNCNNIEDISTVENEIINEYKLDELRINIAQDWSEEDTMVTSYTDAQLQYLKDNYSHVVKGKPKWEWSDCFWVNESIYMTVEGNIKVCCMNTSTKSLGNIFQQSIDTIHSNIEYVAIQEGCKNNQPTSHCKNCSYKELTKILPRVLD